MSELPAGLRIKGRRANIIASVREVEFPGHYWIGDDDRQCSTEVLNHQGEWHDRAGMAAQHYWPTREAAVEAACLAADLPPGNAIEKEPDGYWWRSEKIGGGVAARIRYPTAREAYLAVIAAAAEIKAATPIGGEGWRPIETAPKDGTRILLWCGSVANTFTGQFVKGRWTGARFNTPTHWQPISPLASAE